MTESLPDSESRGETRSGTPGMPRWVRVSVVIGVIFAVALIISMISSGGTHGPGLHTRAIEGPINLQAAAIGWQ